MGILFLELFDLVTLVFTRIKGTVDQLLDINNFTDNTDFKVYRRN